MGIENFRNKVILGDCLEIMPLIPDNSCHMILCDLPYGTTACKWDSIIPFDKLWENYKRIIKDNGAIVLTGSQPFTSALIMSNPSMFRYEWIWEKSKASNFVHARRMPLKTHENILVFYKRLPKYNPQMAQGKSWKNRAGLKGSTTETLNNVPNPLFRHGSPDGLRFPRSVQYFKTAESEGKTLHPTQKPVALFKYLIRTYTNEGDTVLDNAAGSGTTGAACIDTNRDYILIEKEEKYFDITNKRLLGKGRVFGREVE